MKKSVSTHKSKKISSIIKRDGSVVSFNIDKIARAVEKAMHAAKEFEIGAPERVAEAVLQKLLIPKEDGSITTPTVEGVQDLVEAELMLQKFLATAKAYILYREERTKLRYKGVEVPQKVKKLVAESKKYFRNKLGEFIYYRTYSKWIPEENRREAWIETVDRYVDFVISRRLCTSPCRVPVPAGRLKVKIFRNCHKSNARLERNWRPLLCLIAKKAGATR